MGAKPDGGTPREFGRSGPTHKKQDWSKINSNQERILYEKVKREGIGWLKFDQRFEAKRSLQAAVFMTAPQDWCSEHWHCPEHQSHGLPASSSAQPNHSCRPQCPRHRRHTADIREAAMVGFGGVTHGVNMDQHSGELHPNRQQSTQHHLPKQPQNRAPGYYMLFIIDKEGIPARSRIVRVQ